MMLGRNILSKFPIQRYHANYTQSQNGFVINKSVSLPNITRTLSTTPSLPSGCGKPRMKWSKDTLKLCKGSNQERKICVGHDESKKCQECRPCSGEKPPKKKGHCNKVPLLALAAVTFGAGYIITKVIDKRTKEEKKEETPEEPPADPESK